MGRGDGHAYDGRGERREKGRRMISGWHCQV